MSDHTERTSGFGIGGLGGVPESTPLDDLQAAELMAAAQAKAPKGQYKVTYRFESFDDGDRSDGWILRQIEMNKKLSKTEHFETMADMLAFVRALPEGATAYLSAPGFSVGDLTNGVLDWREKEPVDTPYWTCEECGSDEIRNGRCQTCGERDMIRRWTYKFVNHTENLHGEEQ